jgi:hypothetical protein
MGEQTETISYEQRLAEANSAIDNFVNSSTIEIGDNESFPGSQAVMAMVNAELLRTGISDQEIQSLILNTQELKNSYGSSADKQKFVDDLKIDLQTWKERANNPPTPQEEPDKTGVAYF